MLHCVLVPFFFLVVACWNALLGASQNVGSFVPGMVPLGIRSPYFNAWVNGPKPVPNWPTFWNGQILGWSAFARVDGTAWEWVGDAVTQLNNSIVTNIEITPTRTIYRLSAGPMDITITYLTPIEPADPVKQSFPFTYISFEANSTDGQPHSVQVYSDISAEWCSGNRSETVTWSTTSTDSTVFHAVQLQQPTSLTENNNQAEDVTVYHAIAQRPGVTAEIGVDNDCRSQFASTGSLSGNPSSSSGIINKPFEVFALSMDLGNITTTSTPVVWSVGVVRNPVVAYTTGSGQSQSRVPYFVTQYKTIQSAIDAFVTDYSSASSRASDLDNKILNDANAISSQYANLVSLAARQTIGGTELTIGGTNTSDVKIFMKNVGTDRRTNPVEVLYASFPFFLYLNATWGGQLLTPLLEFQDSSQWTQPYAARDLGTTYPQATGNNNPHSQGVEQSGNMLIMSLAHARASGDGSLINLHYNLLKGATADSESQANITNLAIKGIIGIKAMSEISMALGKEDDALYFSNFASTYASTWQSLALSADGQHVLSSYGDPSSSWSMLYNLYADKLLQTQVVTDNIYQQTTTYYESLLSSGAATQFGLPLDSTSLTQTNAAWTLFAAATASNSSVRDTFISQAWSRANISSFFPEVYKLDSTSATVSGISSPAMGAMFSLLALNVANKTIAVPKSVGGAVSTKKSVVGPAVGGVIGGLALLGVVVLGAFFWKRRVKHQFPLHDKVEMQGDVLERPMTVPYNYNPYEQQQDPESAPLRQVQPSQSSVVLPTVATQGGVLASSKAREAAGYLSHRTLPSTVSSSGPSSSGPASSREPPTEASGPTVAHISPTEVQGLRAEVENLRRAMEEIQAERMEAPPGYHDSQAQNSNPNQVFIPSVSQYSPPPTTPYP